MPASDQDQVLNLLGVRPGRVVVLKDVYRGNANWLVETGGGRPLVLRRYHPQTTQPDLAYEHAVLGHLARAGWVVPAAVGQPVCWQGRWYCLTRYVPGQAVRGEDPGQRARRGRDLARLHLALRGAAELLGQRRGWRAQHSAVIVSSGHPWSERVSRLAAVSPRLASWARAAAEQAHGSLAALGAGDLPVMVVHGVFAEWNVHYDGDWLAGVIDFALTHVDSRPYELAIARAYRAPELVDAYRAELAACGWPLSELEEAALTPVYRAFRVGMAAAEMDSGLVTGDYDLPMIERQLSRTATDPHLWPGLGHY